MIFKNDRNAKCRPLIFSAFLLITSLHMHAQPVGVENKDVRLANKNSPYDMFGGWKQIQGTQTGFFHVEQINGIWWTIDPCGNVFLQKGLDTINLYDNGTYDSNFHSQFVDNELAKFKTEKRWTHAIIEQMTKDWKFNTSGSWGSPVWVNDPEFPKIPYAQMVSFNYGGFGVEGAMPDFFSTGFEHSFWLDVLNSVGPRKDDPYLIGYFIQNEGCFGPNYGFGYTFMLEVYLSFQGGPGRDVMLGILESFYGTIGALNLAWNTSFSAFSDITINPNAALPSFFYAGFGLGPLNTRLAQYSQQLGEAETYMWVQAQLTSGTVAGYTLDDVKQFAEAVTSSIADYNARFNTTYVDYDAMVAQPSTPLVTDLQLLQSQAVTAVATKFYDVTTSAIKSIDSNHMILGIKTNPFSLACVPPESITPAVLKNIDIFSIDYYLDNVSELTGNPNDTVLPYDNNDFAFLIEAANYIFNIAQKPMIMGEFSSKAGLEGSGLPSTVGAATPVQTQEQRAQCFNMQVTEFMALPFAVGTHAFELMDQPFTGRFQDGQNSNFGLLDVNGNEWKPVTDAFAELNPQLEKIHLG